MTTGSTIDDLLQLLNVSDSILRYNSSIENNIRLNGGTVLYSYNNIIIASEISENLYNQLKIDSTIDFIESLPLKSYGEIDTSLIDQLNVVKINPSQNSNVVANIVSGITTIGTIGIAPVITNQIFTLSALTNSNFTYNITADGTVPITFKFVKPSNYIGNLVLQNVSNINGSSTSIGTYNIEFTATNSYGSDTRNLVLSIYDVVIITNSNLQTYNKFGTIFSYSIESSGLPPKAYSVSGLPPELSLNNNIITGTFLSAGTYNMIMTVDGLTSSDSKSLTVYVDSVPIITSASSISIEENTYYIYDVTAYSLNDISGINIKSIISGSLPKGMTLNSNRITGSPLETGIFNVNIISSNSIGRSSKQLSITVYKMGS